VEFAVFLQNKSTTLKVMQKVTIGGIMPYLDNVKQGWNVKQ
jgi:hypothetical protein